MVCWYRRLVREAAIIATLPSHHRLLVVCFRKLFCQSYLLAGNSALLSVSVSSYE